MGTFQRRICRCSGSTDIKVFPSQRRAPCTRRWCWRGSRGAARRIPAICCWRWCQTAQGTAADFLRRKRVTSTALAEHTAAHAAGRPRRLHSRDLAPELSKAMEFAVLGAHAASAARRRTSTCSAPSSRIRPARPAGGWRLWASSCRRPRGNAASFLVSLCCPPSRGWLPPARAAPAINMAAT